MVEEGTFERVMEVEAGKIFAIKSAESRKHMSLRGGAPIPEGKKKEFCECLLRLYSQRLTIFGSSYCYADVDAVQR